MKTAPGRGAPASTNTWSSPWISTSCATGCGTGIESTTTHPRMNPPTQRILLAEDHPVSRHLLERNLQNWGFEVVSVQDGVTAAEILAAPDAPSIAVLDWMMPKM